MTVMGGHLGDEREVVAHEHHREAQLLLQLVQEVDDLLLHGHVEGRGGLVGDDDLVARQRHGDEHALALAARQLVGVESSVRFGSRPTSSSSSRPCGCRRAS